MEFFRLIQSCMSALFYFSMSLYSFDMTASRFKYITKIQKEGEGMGGVGGVVAKIKIIISSCQWVRTA